MSASSSASAYSSADARRAHAEPARRLPACRRARSRSRCPAIGCSGPRLAKSSVSSPLYCARLPPIGDGGRAGRRLAARPRRSRAGSRSCRVRSPPPRRAPAPSPRPSSPPPARGPAASTTGSPRLRAAPARPRPVGPPASPAARHSASLHGDDRPPLGTRSPGREQGRRHTRHRHHRSPARCSPHRIASVMRVETRAACAALQARERLGYAAGQCRSGGGCARWRSWRPSLRAEPHAGPRRRNQPGQRRRRPQALREGPRRLRAAAPTARPSASSRPPTPSTPTPRTSSSTWASSTRSSADIDDALKWFRLYVTMNLTPAERERADAYVRRLEGAKKELDAKQADAGAAAAERPRNGAPAPRHAAERPHRRVHHHRRQPHCRRARRRRRAWPSRPRRTSLRQIPSRAATDTFTDLENRTNQAHSEAVAADVVLRHGHRAGRGDHVPVLRAAQGERERVPLHGFHERLGVRHLTGGGALFVQGSF